VAAEQHAMRDKPDWPGLLSVVSIELDERNASAN